MHRMTPIILSSLLSLGLASTAQAQSPRLKKKPVTTRKSVSVKRANKARINHPEEVLRSRVSYNKLKANPGKWYSLAFYRPAADGNETHYVVGRVSKKGLLGFGFVTRGGGGGFDKPRARGGGGGGNWRRIKSVKVNAKTGLLSFGFVTRTSGGLRTLSLKLPGLRSVHTGDPIEIVGSKKAVSAKLFKARPGAKLDLEPGTMDRVRAR